jgi:hypothetical protein
LGEQTLQPADIGIFGPLKRAWKHHISKYKLGICDENGIALLERVDDRPREKKLISRLIYQEK